MIPMTVFSVTQTIVVDPKSGNVTIKETRTPITIFQHTP